MTKIMFVVCFCVLISGITGLPMQQQPEYAQPITDQNARPNISPSTDSDMDDDTQNSTDTAFDPNDGVVTLLMQATSTGSISDFVAQTMVDQCDGRVEPALAFYQCVENSTDLPHIWSAMGLNATMLRIRTLDATTIRGGNVTDRKNVFVTVANNNDAVKTIQDLVTAVDSQLNTFCMNLESLLSCLQPYLDACYPDGDNSNDIVQQQNTIGNNAKTKPLPVQQQRSQDYSDSDDETNRSAVSSNTTEVEASDTQDDDTEQPNFFKIPYLNTQSEITSFVRNTFSFLCDSDAKAGPLKEIIASTPCLFKAMSQDSCDTYQTRLDTVQTSLEKANITTGGPGATNPLLCGALRDTAECALDVVDENCNQLVANIAMTVYQQYFNALQCVDPLSGPNAYPIFLRTPNNQLAL